MSSIRRALLATVAVLSAALPAAAQTTAPAAAAAPDQGPSLLWVWGWILVAGVTIFIIGTSIGVSGRR
jgi:hypothetical protein